MKKAKAVICRLKGHDWRLDKEENMKLVMTKGTMTVTYVCERCFKTKTIEQYL